MSDAPATIEELTRVEVADVTAMTGMLDILVRGDAALGWTDPPSSQEVHDLLTALVAAGPADARILVARPHRRSSAAPPPDENGHRARVVGFGYWQRYERSTLRNNADLVRLAVAPDVAGRGIGRALLRALISTARTAGCEQLTIDFRGDNHRAERLYLSEGFTEYGRLQHFVAPDADRRFDKVFQVLDLRRAGHTH